jgi:hypothetical protein
VADGVVEIQFGVDPVVRDEPDALRPTDGPGIRFGLTGQHVEQRRLARPVRAEHRDPLAALQVEREPLEQRRAVEALGQARHGEQVIADPQAVVDAPDDLVDRARRLPLRDVGQPARDRVRRVPGRLTAGSGCRLLVRQQLLLVRELPLEHLQPRLLRVPHRASVIGLASAWPISSTQTCVSCTSRKREPSRPTASIVEKRVAAQSAVTRSQRGRRL